MKTTFLIIAIFCLLSAGCSTTQGAQAEQPNRSPSPLEVVQAELVVKNESLNFVTVLAKDLRLKIISSVESKGDPERPELAKLFIVTLEGPKQVLECFAKVLGGDGHIIGGKIGPKVRIE